MEEMEFAERETVRRSTDNFSLKVRINFLEDVKKVSRFKTMKLRLYNQNFKFRFRVSVELVEFSKEVNKETEEWLVVLPDISVPKHKQWLQDYDILFCIVSVIDTEDNSKLPRSLAEIFSENDDRYPKYLKKSAILKRKDEFLSEGVLTVRCDIYFYFNTIFSEGLTKKILTCSLPWKLEYKDEVESGFDITKRDCSDEFTIFDFTHQILTLPDFHESRKRFGIYYISPREKFHKCRKFFSSDSEEDSADNFEHVWIFDTESDRFLLSLDEQQDSVGVRLLEASAVIRRCINAPMKERRQKRLHFKDVSTLAFKTVLFFLEHGILPTSPNLDYLSVYKFSHSYEIELLQRKCSEEMVKSMEFSTEELQKTANDYSDEYLTELLFSRLHDREDWAQPIFRLHERLNSDSYI